MCERRFQHFKSDLAVIVLATGQAWHLNQNAARDVIQADHGIQPADPHADPLVYHAQVYVFRVKVHHSPPSVRASAFAIITFANHPIMVPSSIPEFGNCLQKASAQIITSVVSCKCLVSTVTPSRGAGWSVSRRL